MIVRSSTMLEGYSCLCCGKKNPFRGYSYANKYCDNRCQREHEYRVAIENWETSPPGKNRIKRFLTEKFGKKCSVCGIDSWNGRELVLELEHIDGNSENNSKENLCLICPNCHSQTPTYKARNKGNGRHTRRQRYAEGKSF